jgi:hypothetical protein
VPAARAVEVPALGPASGGVADRAADGTAVRDLVITAVVTA